MKEKPILFSSPMVTAILAGNKTQTRRTMNDKFLAKMVLAAALGEVSWFNENGFLHENDLSYLLQFCPYGKVGDRLWLRETHKVIQSSRLSGPGTRDVAYADNPDYDLMVKECGWKTVPSIHMFRDDSRINLEITNIRVERLNDISEDDCQAEGIGMHEFDCRPDQSEDCGCGEISYRDSFASLWESINGQGSWDLNPYLWVVDFKKV